jgi:uncharacterized membrane protein YbhN (UPF0104 family)
VTRAGRFLWPALKYGISVLCLVYVFWDVPFAALGTILKGYPPWPMLTVVLVSFVAYALMGARLSRMATPPLSFRSTFAATLVGLGVNNVLPAKAGEIAKAVWMGRANGVPFQKTLGIVFMERFFDVNVLALLSVRFLWEFGRREAVFAFVVCLAAGWGTLALFHLRPDLVGRFTGLFGCGGLRRFVSQALSGVLDNMSPGTLVWLTVTSLTLWSFYSLQMYISLNEVAGLGLPWSATLTIFAVSGLGMLLPSSPGAIGVYEAVTLAALKNFGVETDAALAVTLFSHMAQFIPVTLAGGLIFMAFPNNTKKKEENIL